MTTRKDREQQKGGSSARSARRRLGRGLSSLISSPVPVVSPDDRAESEGGGSALSAQRGAVRPDADSEVGRVGLASAQSVVESDAGDGTRLSMIPVGSIQPNRRQPRQHFDEAALESLARSIRSAGVMQPIIVRPADIHIDGVEYELIAGERRWRAATLAGLGHVPGIVREVDDATAAELALIENIQREDLNPIERAEAFRKLVNEFALTHQEIAERVGLDRSSVSNLLRLLELDRETIDEVRAGTLTLGHARALLSVADAEERRSMARQVVRQGWSVRELERRIRARNSSTRRDQQSGETAAQIHLRHLADELGKHLGTRVQIEAGRKKGSGKLMIEFYSLDEFESLLERLGYQPT